MNKNQKGFGLVEVFIAIFVVLLVIGASLFFLKNRTRVSISNEGQSFSFDLKVPAKTSARSYQGKSTEYFQATPKGSTVALVATIIKPKASTSDLKQSCKYDKFDATILSKTHTVCVQKQKFFIANFDTEGDWYQAIVFSEDVKSELRTEDVITLMESIQTN